MPILSAVLPLMLIKFLLHFNNFDKLFLIGALYFSNLIFWQIIVMSKFMITVLSRSILFFIELNLAASGKASFFCVIFGQTEDKSSFISTK